MARSSCQTACLITFRARLTRQLFSGGRPTEALMHVLLVEDYRLFSRALTQALEGEGHTVLLAEDGEAADAAVREAEFGLILLDLTLPRADGLTLLRRWRAGGLEAPVLVLTARA